MKADLELSTITLRITMTHDEAKRLRSIHGDTSDRQWREITKQIRDGEDTPYVEEDGNLMARFSQLLFNHLPGG